MPADCKASDSHAEILRQRCLEAVPQRYSNLWRHSMTQRAEYELDLVSKLGRSTDFLLADEVVRAAREADISCRLVGAGCNALVCYLLGLTTVDPLHRQLHVERFLDPQGRWAPGFVFELAPGGKDRLRRRSWIYGDPFTEAAGYVFYTMSKSVDRIYRMARKVPPPVTRQAALARQHPDHLFAHYIFQWLQEDDLAGVYYVGDWCRHQIDRPSLGSLDQIVQHLGGLLPIAEGTRAISADAHFGVCGRFILCGEPLEEASHLIGDSTNDVCFQEDVMALFAFYAGVPIEDGYYVLKQFAKRRLDDVLPYQEQFYRRANALLGRDRADALLKYIERASRLAVCKANYAAEAMTVTAFKLALLKR